MIDKTQEFCDTAIAELEISPRIQNAIEEHFGLYVRDLEYVTELKLSEMPNIGAVAIREIIAALNKRAREVFSD